MSHEEDDDVTMMSNTASSSATSWTGAPQKKQKPAVGGVNPNASLPWVEKYRPETLDDLIAQDDIVSTSTF